MAELSNDPLGQLSPTITYEINHQGSVRLAELAKQAGVARFVYMSSCSVYGVADGEVDETSPVNPQTAYAECKTLVERDLQAMADDDFSPTFMRNATAFGASPRQRFDIVLNNLSGLAWTTKKIAMTSDGSPWRPLVHGLDIAQAIRCALDAPRDVVHNEIFNVGSSEQNYRVREIAEIVGDEFPGCEVTFGDRRRRQPQLPGVLREDRQQAAGLRVPVGRRQGRGPAARGVPHHRHGRGDLHRPRPHPADAAAAPDQHRSGRRRSLLEPRHDHQHAPPIEGVAVIDLELRSDDRGFFARTFCIDGVRRRRPADRRSSSATCPFNHQAGTLRGMHFQIAPHPEAKLVRCIRGAIVDIIVDMRPDSPTWLQHVAVELTADNRRALYVPPYFAHGYQTLVDDTEVIYQVSGSYDARRPSAACATTTRRWASTGRCRSSVISAKDASWPLIADRDVRDYGWQPETVGARS